MTEHRDQTVLCLAICAAFGASLLAISEHVRCMEAGYSLGASRREETVLRREAMQAERALAAVRSPSVVVARAKAWDLGLDYFAGAPAFAATPAAPSATAGAVVPVPAARVSAARVPAGAAPSTRGGATRAQDVRR